MTWCVRWPAATACTTRPALSSRSRRRAFIREVHPGRRVEGRRETRRPLPAGAAGRPARAARPSHRSNSARRHSGSCPWGRSGTYRHSLCSEETEHEMDGVTMCLSTLAGDDRGGRGLHDARRGEPARRLRHEQGGRRFPRRPGEAGGPLGSQPEPQRAGSAVRAASSGSAAPSCSKTTSPPIMVRAGERERRASGGVERIVPSRTTRSASFPGSRLPLIPSSKEA